MSASRAKRIAKSRENKNSAVEWIQEQIKVFANHAPEVVVRALLATFEPITADIKVLEMLSGQEVK